jgi:hypothetical protein
MSTSLATLFASRESKAAFRAANIAEGLCSEGKEHGPPVRCSNTLCEPCYQYLLERTRARRARKKLAP